MKQVGARHDIIREWRLLPKELRQTEEQADAFAMQIKDKYKFSSSLSDLAGLGRIFALIRPFFLAGCAFQGW